MGKIQQGGYSTVVEDGLAFFGKGGFVSYFWYEVLLWNASLLLEEGDDDHHYCIGPFPDTAST